MPKIFRFVDDQFIIKIIKGEASPGEFEFFNKWIEESDANKERYGNLLLIWEKAGEVSGLNYPDSEALWTKIHDRINKEPNVEESVSTNYSGKAEVILNDGVEEKTFSNKISPLIWIARIAAIIIISVGLYYMWDYTSNYYSHQSPVVEEKVEMCELVTGNGQKAEILFSDGSHAFLNSASKIKYPRVFTGKERMVEFSGEAYFKIAKDPSHPFKIITGQTITEVVGTEFNIKYRNNKKFNLVVTEGVVKAYTAESNQKYELKKGEMITYSTSSGFSQPRKINVNPYIAWRKNKLYFRNTPMKEVLDELKICFDVRFDVKDSEILNKKLTGVFRNTSLNNILRALAISMDVVIYKDQNVYVIQKNI